MDLTYTIKRSATRRKLTITVERDRSVVVHAPLDTTDEQIEQMVQSKRQWIYEKAKHEQKYQELPHPPGKELVSGESALYLGRNYRIEVVDEPTEVRFDQGFRVPRQRSADRRDALREWYINKAKEKILPRVRRSARELGVDCNSAKIVDNRYRWGSCTVKDNVNLNWRLIKAPMFVIDYVIIHELAHLIEPNHTDRFWSIVRTHSATADKARAWLRENGQLLEFDI
jgi:predicted metal-dependent hydrolase